jgi:subtilase family serine protease
MGASARTKEFVLSRRVLVSILAAGTIAAAGLTSSLPGASAAPRPTAPRHAERVCAKTVERGHATCFAKVLVNTSSVVPNSASPPPGALTPSQVQDAYKLTGLLSGGRTVAIVDAYGYPKLARDLKIYRAQFGLPLCTKANGCLKVMNQNGGTQLPAFDLGWAGEQALDVDAVSATCPDCKIIMVQANSNSFVDLGKAVNTAAARAGVVAISNSYGTTGGDAPDSTYGHFYNHPGIAVTASTGDNGYQGGSYPASSRYTTAVGGTTLVTAGTPRGWAETVWSGAGSGCSTYNVALPVQSGFNTGCPRRAMADVAAAADPGQGGLAVYFPTSVMSSTWAQIGGTSESAPIIAAVYALSGHTSGYPNALPYNHPNGLYDIKSGSNGTCPVTQWCNARVGWDGPTGVGTPHGKGAF